MELMISGCPVCTSTKLQTLFPSYFGPCITSDMMVLQDAALANRICADCGLIFNADGTRGFEESFYRNSYNLMMRSKEAGVQSFAGGAPVSQAERTFMFLREMLPLQDRGTVLEAGAGKGEFLSYFVNAFPNWQIAAFEPSGAFEVLKSRLPNANLQNCSYQEFEIVDGSVDLFVALGVLEHVDNPLHMLQWVARVLRPGGYAYIRVPNFANNPNDLFCADHLSKLTVPTLRALAAAAGFNVFGVKESGVPVFLVLRAHSGLAVMANAFADNIGIAERNVETAASLIESIMRARTAAKQANEAFGIFGLASAGLFAPLYGGFPPDEIAAYIDENKTVWGSSIHGRPVIGLEGIPKANIKHVALAISPVYFQQVQAKLEPYGVKVYTA